VQLIPSDPNIETLVSRITNGEINLQPDFQRGEVWSYQKKQKLIDTILRNWHVPPIHLVVVSKDGSREVLDGQQRLVSIRDFVNGEVVINGKQPPLDHSIESLDGLSYKQLPKRVKREFDDYSIRVFSITDYQPEEPGELFYRLNQPTSLTAAEQRNAFYGPVRNQIKEMVNFANQEGLNYDFLGFSNSRMAYDDVFSRLALTFDTGTFLTKITSARITEYYRSSNPLSVDCIDKIKCSLLVLSAIKNQINSPVKFNRASLYTWLCFFIQLRMPYQNPTHPKIGILAKFLTQFEYLRMNVKQGRLLEKDLSNLDFSLESETLFRLMSIYNDRASSRIYDVSSTLMRDIITWISFADFQIRNLNNEFFDNKQLQLLSKLNPKINISRGSMEHVLETFVSENNWGREI
jgi:hypothetical protein